MLHLIVKPLKGKKQKLLEALKSRLESEGVPYALHFTSTKGDGAALGAKCSEEKGSIVAVVGGDGTVNDVLSGLDLTNAALGIIPAGTGNDFAAACKIPEGVAALDLILHSEPKRTDYLQFSDGKRSLNIAGLGIDVDILERCERMRNLHAKSKYFLSLLKSLCSYRGTHLKIESGEFCVEGNFLIAALCNGEFLGGGIPLCPDADVADGHADLVFVDCPPRRKLLGALIKLMKGKVFSLPFAHHMLVKEAKFTPAVPFTAQYDGELYSVSEFSAKICSDLMVYRG